ncbi:Ldh family oxidoreductase [Bradyrhizobium sp. LHD-71]|uniref:Ldh family oxidoreductase n=1 Tax=Bradyrhizobium sp. LHD-71 TaxID=3072141 RepID=UPI00280D1C58|nr:Ldh family oxidoreductase [Bradyrhizobium sp. LHD-71]MDQ8731454.1 Ldh family oxidoreductase [Bradyrhizobium sp. LHD-71]
MTATDTLLDQDGPDKVRLSIEEARALGEQACQRLGFSAEDARIITDQLVENALRGYRFASLPRILAIQGDERSKQARKPISIVKETPVSALVDGGNNVGYVAAYRAAEIAIAKARTSGMSVVSVYDSYYSGRNAYFTEMVVNAGFVCIHTASAKPRVLPPGGVRPALGTNPFCIGFPSKNGPVIYDIGTASLMWGEVLLHARLGEPLPDGVGFDEAGRPSTNADEVIKGGVIPFAGHKGYGLSFAIQALGLLGGAARARGLVQDYAFFFIAIDPAILLEEDEFEQQMAELVARIKATPKGKGVEEIRIPGERGARERKIRARQGIVFDRAVIEALRSI